MSSEAAKPSTLYDVSRMPYQRLGLRGDWHAFVGSVPATEQWTMLVSGPSGSGKSSFCLGLAKELSRFGHVLYVAAEERLKSGTIRIRAKVMHITSQRIWIYDTISISDVVEELKTGRYAYCLIDSVQELRATVEESLELKEQFPDISFIFVAQADAAERRSLGGHKVKHMVDIRVWTEAEDDGSRWAVNLKNRYAPTKSRLHLYTPAGFTPTEGSKSGPITISTIKNQRTKGVRNRWELPSS
jgi:predicted ATP-dependent serine protease